MATHHLCIVPYETHVHVRRATSAKCLASATKGTTAAAAKGTAATAAAGAHAAQRVELHGRVDDREVVSTEAVEEVGGR